MGFVGYSGTLGASLERRGWCDRSRHLAVYHYYGNADEKLSIVVNQRKLFKPAQHILNMSVGLPLRKKLLFAWFSYQASEDFGLHSRQYKLPPL